MPSFGTDGVRGRAGTELDARLALKLGASAVRAAEARHPQIVVVRDTRESGPMLEAALAAGVAQAGGDALLAGVLPTPAASVLVRRLGLDLAAIVSASHNPWQDNGIKLLGPDGGKLDDELENEIGELLAGDEAAVFAGDGDADVGGVRLLEGGLDDYVRELERHFKLDLSGRRIALDLANGATHLAAPRIFRQLGAEVVELANRPDGRNINEGCGSTHPEALSRLVRERDCEIGFAFDGDGDRLMAVDEQGTVRDGDEMMAVIALERERRGELGGGVAVTVMSNYGFHAAMREAGVEVAVTAVGDRHVASELVSRGWPIGGEQSGHIINRELQPTGDGIASALTLLDALGERRLSEAVPMRRLPQSLLNVRVGDREAYASSQTLAAEVERAQSGLEGRGRVLVRPSGTEPLIRVMVEAPTAEECERVCGELARVIERELGG